ncbi:MAG: ABC transporter substrate-binding protein, partial [Leptolyngbya sp. SIO4C1]|nr:ABC transporter substrate-binding protein [Leptolyngbya sp. SIO4C1]
MFSTQERRFAWAVAGISIGLLALFFVGLERYSRGRLFSKGPVTIQKAEAEIEPVSRAAKTAESAEAAPEVRLSQGEASLLLGRTNADKAAGVAAIAAQSYQAAVSALEAARQTDPADPETLIYLNNARIGDADAYTIAAAVPIESAPELAESLLRGVAQAQTEVNQAGGIRGQRLRVLIADDGNSSVFAEALAAQLVQEAEVIGVIGHSSTPAAMAAASIYDNRLLALLPTNTTAAELGDYALQTLTDDALVAGAIANFIAQLNRRQAALFYDSRSDHSRALKSLFESALLANGGQFIAQTNIADMNLANIEQAGNSPTGETAQTADIYAVFPSDSELDKALTAVAAAKSNTDSRYRPIFSSYELFSPAVLDQLGEAADGALLAVPDEIYMSAASPFRDRAQAR